MTTALPAFRVPLPVLVEELPALVPLPALTITVQVPFPLPSVTVRVA
jgi:hypothetical protein